MPEWGQTENERKRGELISVRVVTLPGSRSIFTA